MRNKKGFTLIELL
ncbi:prepilin-type N-terminal cleavage/methylation domain-containing protein, partial [Patescibacteria group bacterium]|nr:prepilin-type N-terminal cleavage/methylation domain-containing protein [Patescibacteria group bacterium]